MLVLTRKKGQQILIGDGIVVTVSSVQGNSVRLGIEARREVKILRGELKRFAGPAPADAAAMAPTAEFHGGGLAPVQNVAGVPPAPIARPR